MSLVLCPSIGSIAFLIIADVQLLGMALATFISVGEGVGFVLDGLLLHCCALECLVLVGWAGQWDPCAVCFILRISTKCNTCSSSATSWRCRTLILFLRRTSVSHSCSSGEV